MGGGVRVVVIIDGGPLRRGTPGDPWIVENTEKNMPARGISNVYLPPVLSTHWQHSTFGSTPDIKDLANSEIPLQFTIKTAWELTREF